MTRADTMTPYALALRDFLNGRTSAAVVLRRDDGHTTSLPAGMFFRDPAEFSELERTALELCRGHVLDVGGGAGCHSLFLQERGLSVCAIDIAPEAVDVMRGRGVRDARCADILDFAGGAFDTILMMMHGIGLVESLSGLDRFLTKAHELLEPDGQIVLDSLDVRSTNDPVHLSYHEANRRAGRSIGEVRLRFEYNGRVGSEFRWFQIDPELLGQRASQSGWSCEIVRLQDDGTYLAQLTSRLAA